ncbi:hypothetical protein DFQ27_007892 [Actinomortierella ambigua]|uniref:Uncharacterized protein n=1 Tax=Actinomortierella ambigua TaxID=1343610 RepID=A0A9P6PTS2_9FUNG|nr:hypothetical protein DFQ27_007892 [Actinomortierella ambigua]
MPVSITTTVTSVKAQQVLPAASLARLQMLEERIAYRYSQDRIDQGLDEHGNEIEVQSGSDSDDNDDDMLSSAAARRMDKAEDPIQFQWLLRTLAKLEECAPPEEEEEDEEEEEEKDNGTKEAHTLKKPTLVMTKEEEEYRSAHERLVNRVSAAMAHLCGRAASGAVTRTWTFKTHPFPKEIQIHDPSFIGGDVGFKTFGSAYLLSKHIAHGHLPQLEPWVADNSTTTVTSNKHDYPRILEIGSGTGLTGFTASMYTPPWAPKVVLSDYHPNVLSTLHENCRRNKLEHRVDIQALDWRHVLNAVEQEQQQQQQQQGENDSNSNSNNNNSDTNNSNGSTTNQQPESESMDIILGAEVVYDHGHAKLVAHVVDRFLKRERRSTHPSDRPAFHLMFPIRPTHTDVIAELDHWMDKLGFVDVREHKEYGREDGETVFLYHWREYVRREHL